MPPLLIPVLIGLGVSAATAAILAPIIVDVAIIGITLLLSAVFAPGVPKPDDVKTPLKQPVPSRMRILGRRRSGGAYMLYHSYRGSTFYGVIAVCDGEVASFDRYWLHDDVVEVLFHVVQGIESATANRYGDGKVQIFTRSGEVPSTSFTADVPGMVSDLVGIWTSDHRGDGIAAACIRAADAGQDDQAQRCPFGIPELSVEVNATRVFDPRRQTMGTGSPFGSAPFKPGGSGIFAGDGSPGGSFGGQDWRDRSTWGFSGNDNPILQAAWLITAPVADGGFGLDFEESFSTVLDDLEAQANICDEAVPLKAGGSEKRYISGALYKYSDAPSDVLAAILGTCDGFIAERGDGAFEIKAGKWDADDFAITITDKHILSLHVTRFRPDEDEVTGIIVKYNSVAHSHILIDAPVWPRDAYQGGEDRRVRSIEVSFCPQGVQAQRLSKRVAIYEMAPVRGTMLLNMYGILLLDRRGCTIQCTDDPALADAKVRLTRIETNLADRTVEVDFTVFDPDECDAWDPATEEGPLQPPVSVPVDDARSVPVNLLASPVLVGGKVNVDLQFDPGDSAGSSFTAEWRLADAGGGVPGNWNFITGLSPEKPEDHRWIVVLSGLPVDILEFAIRAGSSPSYSSIVSADLTNPGPGRVNSLATALVGADVHVSWTSPNSSNFDHARVYRVAHGSGFGLAADISGPVAGSPSSAMSFDDLAPLTGDYDYYVVSETAAAVTSLAQGPSEELVP